MTRVFFARVLSIAHLLLAKFILITSKSMHYVNHKHGLVTQRRQLDNYIVNAAFQNNRKLSTLIVQWRQPSIGKVRKFKFDACAFLARCQFWSVQQTFFNIHAGSNSYKSLGGGRSDGCCFQFSEFVVQGINTSGDVSEAFYFCFIARPGETTHS